MYFAEKVGKWLKSIPNIASEGKSSQPKRKGTIEEGVTSSHGAFSVTPLKNLDTLLETSSQAAEQALSLPDDATGN